MIGKNINFCGAGQQVWFFENKAIGRTGIAKCCLTDEAIDGVQLFEDTMNFMHTDVGLRRVGDVLEVTISSVANVLLMDTYSFNN